ncbi:MAG TPA: DNA ligase D [Burkholderiaceae bacterium]|nr:DNA ligase D [Burkholderiaceae bacterium]
MTQRSFPQGSAAAELAEYKAKRSFEATPEPGPQVLAARSGPLLFVVQQHAARRLHFDLRLELDGVLKSWAVPKGLLVGPGEPHLAVPTEDHPLAYGAFEGVIPKGQYGAGNVIVWDCGIYSPDEGGVYAFDDRAAAEERVRTEVAAGKLSVSFLGAKLKGSYSLVRAKEGWLVIKHRDKRPVRAAGTVGTEQSVLSGHTVTSVANLAPSERIPFERLIADGPREATPEKLTPMLAGAAPASFNDRRWLFEPKLDGYRVLAHVTLERVCLRSRGGLDLTAAFPGIVEDLAAQLVQPLVLDGEIIAFQDGQPSFNALQNRARLHNKVDVDAAERTTPCVFFCFDVLHALGMNLRPAPYCDRRRYLAQCLLPTARVQIVHAEEDGEALYRAAVAAGFEGMMAKRKTSVYVPGRRSDDWLKIKHTQTAEFVVGGFTEGKGARRDRFGALVLGAWQDGQLQPVGNVGSGFDDATLASLRKTLDAQRVAKMPFATKPEAESKIVWVKPELVAEVQFAGWTDDGLLRAPVFLRLRDDVDPQTVRRRNTTAAAASAADPIDTVLEQLTKAGANPTLTVNGQRLRLTHLDKMLWPAVDAPTGAQPPITKRDLLRYLAQVSPYMLPHLADRPLTVIRMPEGIHGEMFFQKHWGGMAVPPFVRMVELVSDDGASKYVLCNNLETLLWLGQMAVLEFHVPHARLVDTQAERIAEDEVFDRPDYVVFDLDPYIYSGQEAKGAEPEYNKRAFAKTREVAFHLRDLLAAMSLQAFVKTTGKTGLHVFVPIERNISADQAREVCRLVGEHLLRQHPKDITMDWAVPKRTGKIFYDHNMNGRGRTLNAAYSPRRVAGAPVATPVTWEELAQIEPGDFRLLTAVGRLRQNGDPWQGISAARHDLNEVVKAI